MPDAKAPVHTAAAVSRAPTTCGPWRVGRLADMQSGIARIDDRCGTPICYTEAMLTDEVANGNATLIAAAPDLLAAARNLSRCLHAQCAKSDDLCDLDIEECETALDQAIAKAEGRA